MISSLVLVINNKASAELQVSFLITDYFKNQENLNTDVTLHIRITTPTPHPFPRNKI